MRGRFFLFAFAIVLGMRSPALAQTWKVAVPGLKYEFPRDHHSHPGFKTEWWYFTGALHTVEGKEDGFELTLFRQGVRAPGAQPVTTSRFIVPAFAFADFALSEPPARFRFQKKMSRGAFGEAGWDQGNKLAWIDDWTVDLQPDGSFQLCAATPDYAVQLHLTPEKPPVIEGENGISQKADGVGRASYYYSMTRLAVNGQLTSNGKTSPVTGECWFDHEWATNQLSANQLGWNWLSLQMADNSELMLYQMRLKNGGIDHNSSGTFVRADGTAVHLRLSDFEFTPLSTWKSASTGAVYPLKWRVKVPKAGLELTVETPLPDQELAASPVTYWEGLVHAAGVRDGKPVAGHGYLELTGYAGALTGIADHKNGESAH